MFGTELWVIFILATILGAIGWISVLSLLPPRRQREINDQEDHHAPPRTRWWRSWFFRKIVLPTLAIVLLIALVAVVVPLLMEWLNLSWSDIHGWISPYWDEGVDWLSNLSVLPPIKSFLLTYVWNSWGLAVFIVSTAVLLAVVIIGHKPLWAAVLAAVLAIALAAYLFPPEPICVVEDTACVVNQADRAAARLAEELRKEQERQLQAAARQNTPGGLMPMVGRMVIEPRAECIRHVIDPYTFESTYAPYPANGRCSTAFIYPVGTCAMFKATEDGPEQGPFGDCLGSKTPDIPIDPKFARSIDAPFSVKLTVDQPITTRVFR